MPVVPVPLQEAEREHGPFCYYDTNTLQQLIDSQGTSDTRQSSPFTDDGPDSTAGHDAVL